MSDPQHERLDEVEEHIEEAKKHAEQAVSGTFSDADKPGFYESGEEGKGDEDQTGASPG